MAERKRGEVVLCSKTERKNSPLEHKKKKKGKKRVKGSPRESKLLHFPFALSQSTRIFNLTLLSLNSFLSYCLPPQVRANKACAFEGAASQTTVSSRI